MLSVFWGENQFALRQAIQDRVNAAGVLAEHKDGASISHAALNEAVQGVNLFSPNRVVIIEGLSAQPDLFERVPALAENVADTTDVIIVEDKLDKRTSAYKALVKAGLVHEFAPWTERDRAKAVDWCIAYAKTHGASLTPVVARALIDRIGLDQWALASALQKLALLETIDTEALRLHVDAEPNAAVFGLLEAALNGRRDTVKQSIDEARVSQDVYRLFGLITSQVVQLAVMDAASHDVNPSKDFAMHPYVVGKLEKQAKAIGKKRVQHAVSVFAKADADLKRSKADPWLLLEKALIEVGQ